MAAPLKPLAERTWTGDFERVYEQGNAYIELLDHLSRLAFPYLRISPVSEKWHRSAKSIDIEIVFMVNGQRRVLWVERRGDYYNTSLLYLLNDLLPDVSLLFTCIWQDESILLVTPAEREYLWRNLPAEETDERFDGWLYNLQCCLQYNETGMLYTCLKKLLDHAGDAMETGAQSHRLQAARQDLRTRLIPLLDWQELETQGIDAVKIYTLLD